MSDQNNNNGQPQQPYKPYQGQPPQGQQPYQPYQGQPPQGQQPYQPYQGQQPYQPYQPYQGQPPVPPKKKSKWWIWLIVAAVVILAVGALFLFGVIDVGGSGVRRVGNEGAWDAYDYFDTMEDKVDKIMSASQKELRDRVESDAFEIDGELDIKSDLFKDSGLGIDKIGTDFEIKYDKKDLGIKLDIIDLISANVYLIEEDVVVGLMDEFYSIPLDPDTDVDLSEEMSLKDRLDALSAISSDGDFTALFERVMAELAPAIPDELTEKEKADVYSPLEDDEVEMNAVTTKIEQDDLQEIINNFGENLEQNEELKNDLQDFLDSVSNATDEEMDIDDLVEDMIDLDEDELEELDDFEITWSVYEYKGDNVGLSVEIENGGETMKLTMVTEYTNDSMYVYALFEFEGMEMVLNSQTTFEGDDTITEAEIEIKVPEDEFTDAQEIKITLDGTTTVEKDSSTEYEFSGDYKIKIDAGDDAMMEMGIDGPMEIEIEVSGDCVFGDDLGYVEDDDDWNEVYDEDWGDIEDLMGNLFNFGGFGGFDALDEFGGMGDFGGL